MLAMITFREVVPESDPHCCGGRLDRDGFLGQIVI